MAEKMEPKIKVPEAGVYAPQDFGIDECRSKASNQEKSELFCRLRIGSYTVKHSLIISHNFDY